MAPESCRNAQNISELGALQKLCDTQVPPYELTGKINTQINLQNKVLTPNEILKGVGMRLARAVFSTAG